jgi:hypothetical protein
MSSIIKGDKKAAAMFFNVPAERHLSKGVPFFLTAKITSSARCEKNVVDVTEIAGEISDFVPPLYSHHNARPSDVTEYYIQFPLDPWTFLPEMDLHVMLATVCRD